MKELITRLLNILIIFTEPWTNEIMLNIMQNFKFGFPKTNFRPTAVYVLSSISKTLHDFSTRFLPMYRGTLELKNDTRIMRKNSSFSNKTCCGFTALFLKTKIYFCRCNQGGLNKKEIQINLCNIFSIFIINELYLFT